MLILGIIVFGMAIGWVAQLILGRSREKQWGQALVAGLGGSFVGGLVASLVSGDGLKLKPSGLIGSIVGAIVIVLIWDALAKKKAGSNAR